MRAYRKKDFPVSDVRRFLEPGPIVLISSAWKGKTNIMTMGWHMVLMDEPPLVGGFIWDQNDSHELVRRSRECVINVPAVDLIRAVVRIGNCHGRDVDKFAAFGLTPQSAARVGAPLIAECFANFECRLVDRSLIRRYSLFVFEVVQAHVARTPSHAPRYVAGLPRDVKPPPAWSTSTTSFTCSAPTTSSCGPGVPSGRPRARATAR